MIQIIKHGNPPLEKPHKFYFTCERCGCEWIADNKHVTANVGGMGHIWISCNCPECCFVESIDTAKKEG